MPCQLHHDRAHRPGAPVDQQPLAGLHPRLLDQALPGRERHQGDAGCLYEAHGRGQQRHQ